MVDLLHDAKQAANDSVNHAVDSAGNQVKSNPLKWLAIVAASLGLLFLIARYW